MAQGKKNHIAVHHMQYTFKRRKRKMTTSTLWIKIAPIPVEKARRKKQQNIDEKDNELCKRHHGNL